MPAGPPSPLEGVVVLDFTIALAGPYCTLLLADLGADVVKVESPEGDQSRGWGPPFVEGESSYFMSVNRNKRSAVLDLKSDAGRAAARRLAARADVLVENLRPGTLAKLGLGAEEMMAANPRLIYCSVSGFGRDRPEAGYDQIVQGTSGVMSLTGFPDGPPVKFGVPIGDISAGMFAAHAVLAALYERERTGRGRLVDVAMQDALMALLTYQGGRYFATGAAPAREGNFHPTIAPYGAFATQDGFINVGVGSESQFRAFAAAMGIPELVEDERFRSNRDRQRHRAELNQLVEARLRERPTSEWKRALDAAGVPAGPILDLAEVFADPGVKERGIEVTVEHPKAGEWHMVGTPWRLDGEPFTVRRPPPLLGQHTDEVLGELDPD